MTLIDAIALIQSTFAPIDATEMIIDALTEPSESIIDSLPPSTYELLRPAFAALNDAATAPLTPASIDILTRYAPYLLDL